jgi:hypothetical protein
MLADNSGRITGNPEGMHNLERIDAIARMAGRRPSYLSFPLCSQPRPSIKTAAMGPAYGVGALRLSRCRSKYTSAALNNVIHDE